MEAWLYADTWRSVVADYGNFRARDNSGEVEDVACESIAALGHALLDQGRVTIQEEGEG